MSLSPGDAGSSGRCAAYRNVRATIRDVGDVGVGVRLEDVAALSPGGGATRGQGLAPGDSREVALAAGGFRVRARLAHAASAIVALR